MAAVDNIDYIPSAATAKDSFHGTGISMMLYPSHAFGGCCSTPQPRAQYNFLNLVGHLSDHISKCQVIEVNDLPTQHIEVFLHTYIAMNSSLHFYSQCIIVFMFFFPDLSIQRKDAKKTPKNLNFFSCIQIMLKTNVPTFKFFIVKNLLEIQTKLLINKMLVLSTMIKD